MLQDYSSVNVITEKINPTITTAKQIAVKKAPKQDIPEGIG